MSVRFFATSLWRRRFWLLGVSLLVDAVLLAFFSDTSSSFYGAEIAGPLFAVAGLVAGAVCGAVLGLAGAAFLGALFWAIVAPLSSRADRLAAIVAIGLWSVLAMVAGLVSQRRAARRRARTSGPRLVIPLPAQSAAVLRSSLRALLQSHEIDADTVEEVVLAAQEAFNNAVVHPPGAVDVAASVCAGSVWIHVEDEGPGFDCTALPGVPELLLERGRGVYLMRSLMDVVAFESGESGTRVHMSRALRPCSACAEPAENCPQPFAAGRVRAEEQATLVHA